MARYLERHQADIARELQDLIETIGQEHTGARDSPAGLPGVSCRLFDIESNQRKPSPPKLLAKTRSCVV